VTIYYPASTTFARPRTGTKKPKSGKARTYPERAIQTAIVAAVRKYCKPHDGFCYAIPNGGSRGSTAKDRAIRGAMLKAEGVVPGMPDLVFPLPGGVTAYLEIKSAKGRQSVQQEFIEKRLTALGHRYAVAHSIDEAWGVLAAWGVLPSAVGGRDD
jgi:hypothetical protein